MAHRILLVLLLSVATTAGAEPAPLTLGVHPFLPAPELVQRFTPLARYVETTLGHPVEVSISPSYRAHVARAAAGEFTVAFLGPAPLAALSQGGEAPSLPLLAALQIEGRTRFHGVIITRDDSPLVSPGDLAGRRFATVTMTVCAGWCDRRIRSAPCP